MSEQLVEVKDAELAEETVQHAPVSQGPNLALIEPAAATRLAEIEAEIIETLKQGDASIAESKKDELYVKLKTLVSEFVHVTKNADFDFVITKDHYAYMLNVLETQLTYGIDEVFVAMQLKELFLYKKPDFKGRRTPAALPMTPQVMILLYHLISKHRVKGLGQTAENFAFVLRAIGEVSKCINHFEEKAKRLETDVDNWVVFVTPLEEQPPVDPNQTPPVVIIDEPTTEIA